MKTTQFAITVASVLLSCDAFAPQTQKNVVNVNTRRTHALNAETLEGWKINGNVKPVNNFILIEKAKEQSESDGGILLSNSVRFLKTYFFNEWICSKPNS